MATDKWELFYQARRAWSRASDLGDYLWRVGDDAERYARARVVLPALRKRALRRLSAASGISVATLADLEEKGACVLLVWW